MFDRDTSLIAQEMGHPGFLNKNVVVTHLKHLMVMLPMSNTTNASMEVYKKNITRF